MESLAGCVLEQATKLSTILHAAAGPDFWVIDEADLVLDAIHSFRELELSVDELLHPREKSAMES